MHVAVEIDGVAAVADDAVAVARFLVEAERHAVHLRVEPELSRVHQLHRVGAEDARAPYSPPWRWASMKRVMSIAETAQLPAGNAATNS